MEDGKVESLTMVQGKGMSMSFQVASEDFQEIRRWRFGAGRLESLPRCRL